MKFKKEIVDNRVTPDTIKNRKEVIRERLAAEEKLEKESNSRQKRMDEDMVRSESADMVNVALRRDTQNKAELQRISAYPQMQVQLDMLWHDINSGKISANTTSKGTWYHSIKMIKATNPIS